MDNSINTTGAAQGKTATSPVAGPQGQPEFPFFQLLDASIQGGVEAVVEAVVGIGPGVQTLPEVAVAEMLPVAAVLYPGGESLPPGGEILPLVDTAPLQSLVADLGLSGDFADEVAEVAPLPIDALLSASPLATARTFEATPLARAIRAPLPTAVGTSIPPGIAVHSGASTEATRLLEDLPLAAGLARVQFAALEPAPGGSAEQHGATSQIAQQLATSAGSASAPTQFAGLSNFAASMTAVGVETADGELETPRGADPGARLATPVGSPRWAESVGQRINWLAGNGIGRAEIQLDPPELGRLNVEIQIRGEQAQINFQSDHAPVREALESAMPRLREMMAQAGFSATEFGVSQQDQQQRQSEQGSASSLSNEPQADAMEAAPGVMQSMVGGDRLVDFYA